MDTSNRLFQRLYAYPSVLLALIFVLLIAALAGWPRFSFDASSDTLVVEGDPALAYYREISQRFGGDEFLILTYRPLVGEQANAEARREALFSRASMARIGELQARLADVDGVGSVFSILDAPLLDHPDLSFGEITNELRTLRDDDADLDQAARELTSSPVFADLLVSRDGTTTALRIDLADDPEIEALYDRRAELRGRDTLSSDERAELRRVENAYSQARGPWLAKRDAMIREIRQIRAEYSDEAELHLGGVPMIAADMIEFVRNDVVIFGTGVALMVLLMLSIFFRQLRWVVLPVTTAAVSISLVIGGLGWLNQPVTVVSSNFIALLAIICISFTIHLIVRYRELQANDPEGDHRQRVIDTMDSKFAPCLYTALTTMVAFGSLVSSGIVPVVDFGWMMFVGVAVAFFVVYSYFPALLLLMGPGRTPASLHRNLGFTEALSRLARNHHRPLLGLGAVLVVVAAGGLAQLNLDNRFIDYFKADTEIRQGMIYIDQNLGGTVPFDVIVSFAPYEEEALDEDDDFFFAGSGDEDPFPERYWFTPDKISLLNQIQDYLHEQPQVGHVLSLANLEAVGRGFNDGRALDGLQLALILEAMPDEFRRELINPYAAPYHGELRISGRIQESGPIIDRDAFIRGIHEHATNQINLDADRIQVTGMLVLFNDTLQQLFSSQANTLIYVVLATLAMFWILLRSLKLAVLGLLPNLLAAALVIGIMGYAAISLDMMTITVAAISIGIGVDNAIHYLHRFREEYEQRQDARDAVRKGHQTIGRAMYFTSVTIIAGFSLLVFSNFVPTIYFGIFAAMAMGLALLANLTLLPSLLIGAYRSAPVEARAAET